MARQAAPEISHPAGNHFRPGVDKKQAPLCARRDICARRGPPQRYSPSHPTRSPPAMTRIPRPRAGLVRLALAAGAPSRSRRVAPTSATTSGSSRSGRRRTSPAGLPAFPPGAQEVFVPVGHSSEGNAAARRCTRGGGRPRSGGAGGAVSARRALEPHRADAAHRAAPSLRLLGVRDRLPRLRQERRRSSVRGFRLRGRAGRVALAGRAPAGRVAPLHLRSLARRRGGDRPRGAPVRGRRAGRRPRRRVHVHHARRRRGGAHAGMAADQD